ncbi:MAG TPA: NADH-quinone oxidoreductase subunit NuoK [Myxococcales bacterium]|jgi:NADH-quinone oxidoreductase subunit K|nr:NADH-quinone oxidoreductase subunit NuoK [Myxococcales bacterium]
MPSLPSPSLLTLAATFAPGVILEHYLLLAAILFAIGMLGVVTRRNALTMFMSIELMLNAANLTFLAFARVHADLSGHVTAILVMAVAAAEAAVGLAIVIALQRVRGTTNVDEVRTLKL